MTGLQWLSDYSGGWVSCLVFVHRTSVEDVFRRFGACPAQPVTARPKIGAPFPRMTASQQILGRQCGDWTLVIDGTVPQRSLQLEVLERTSAGTDAIVILNDTAKGNHQLVHAWNGNIITAVTTSVPPFWEGDDPDRLRGLAEELGLGQGADADLSDLEILLVLAESAFGISMDPDDLQDGWYAAQARQGEPDT